MIADGTIAEDDPVELIEGGWCRRCPGTRRTGWGRGRRPRRSNGWSRPAWYVAVQEAIVIGPESKPEPDVSVVPAELEFDATRDPLAAECCLVVEVADSSLEYDRTKKLALYAAAGIPVYWIVNLIDRVVEVYTDPTGRSVVRRPCRSRGESEPVGRDRRPGRRHDRRGGLAAAMLMMTCIGWCLLAAGLVVWFLGAWDGSTSWGSSSGREVGGGIESNASRERLLLEVALEVAWSSRRVDLGEDAASRNRSRSRVF